MLSDSVWHVKGILRIPDVFEIKKSRQTYRDPSV